MTENSSKTRRRVVTGHKDGKAVVVQDLPIEGYEFETVPGFLHAYLWKTSGTEELLPSDVDLAMRTSALPSLSQSLFNILTLPPIPSASEVTADVTSIQAETVRRLPGLADLFESDGMHVTKTVDYAIVLDGILTLELDDGLTVELFQGDVVVQQATRHAWRNLSDRPVTVAIILIG